ncbi:golgi-body localization protein domain-containing protein [Chytridium lagenaria]|nr:golgi-body localization protein domain-containing protein [Chytridium lagenaria]
MRISRVWTPNSAFKNLLAPYAVDAHGLDFQRNKMLRVYWRELAPVAGIPVVEHLEINFFPLNLQLTRHIGKRFKNYFFPNKPTKLIKSATVPINIEDTPKNLATPRQLIHSSTDIGNKGLAINLDASRWRQGSSRNQDSKRQRDIDELKEMQSRSCKQSQFYLCESSRSTTLY